MSPDLYTASLVRWGTASEDRDEPKTDKATETQDFTFRYWRAYQVTCPKHLHLEELHIAMMLLRASKVFKLGFHSKTQPNEIPVRKTKVAHRSEKGWTRGHLRFDAC